MPRSATQLTSSSIRSDIKVTPLVDVCLVLLIIFIVVTPMTQVGYDVQVSPEKEGPPVPVPPLDQLVVRLDAEERIFLNQEQIAYPELGTRLRQAMTNRGSKLVFFAADGKLTYGKVAAFMDLCRDSGAENLGIVFEDLEPGAGAGSVLRKPA